MSINFALDATQVEIAVKKAQIEKQILGLFA